MSTVFVMREEDITRFRAKVGPLEGNGCRYWSAARFREGYGAFRLNKRTEYAHRIAYFLATGQQPGELDVLHSCDTPHCVSDRHLSLGTHGDNMKDATEKGRMNVGENHGMAKLVAADIRAIREGHLQGRTRQEMAAEYGVTPYHIGDIVNFKVWKHL